MNIDISNKIKARNLNLDYVYRMTGVSKYTLAKWEKGKYDPRLSETKRLAKILKVDLGRLLFINIEIEDKVERTNSQILKLRRKAMGLGLIEFANMLGISAGTLIRIEKGEYDLRLSLINKLHKILRISMQELINL